jgi:hypothetical protein
MYGARDLDGVDSQSTGDDCLWRGLANRADRRRRLCRRVVGTTEAGVAACDYNFNTPETAGLGFISAQDY